MYKDQLYMIGPLQIILKTPEKHLDQSVIYSIWILVKWRANEGTENDDLQ